MSIKITEMKRIWFEKVNKSKNIYYKNTLIKKLCEGKDVLDVGCIGQDVDYTSSEWIHNQVKKVSNSTVGVDVNKEGIEYLKGFGYEILHFRELNINNKFDVILMLDVIEHVNDPVEFLLNYQKYLKDDGFIIVTTPNSNRAINFLSIFFKNEYPLNYEHTFWFCPKTFLEVVERVGFIEPINFYWLSQYSQNQKMNWKQKVLFYFKKFLENKSSNFSPNFMFVLRSKL